MSKLGEGGANGNGLLAVDKSGANFGFGGGGHDIGKNLGKGEDGAIDGGFTRRGLMSNRGKISKEVIASGAAASFGIGKNIGKGEDGAIDGGLTRRGLVSNRGKISKEVIDADAAASFGIG